MCVVHPPSPKLQWSVSAEGEVLEVDLQPADSWATPTSYYPLEYQIEYLKKDNGKVTHTHTHTLCPCIDTPNVV